MDTIQQPISAEALTGFQRVARHENFVIQADLNMVQQIRIITLGADGQPMVERLMTNESLTPAQKQAGLIRYQDQQVTRTTAGAFVNPQTGQVVASDAEGAVDQRTYFQNITLGMLKKQGLTINDNTPVASLIYALISQEIVTIDNRGDL